MTALNAQNGDDTRPLGGTVHLRQGRHAVNLVLLVEYQEGGETILDECYTLTGDDTVYSIGSELVAYGHKLQQMAEDAEDAGTGRPS